jgi:hypothetical protein
MNLGSSNPRGANRPFKRENSPLLRSFNTSTNVVLIIFPLISGVILTRSTGASGRFGFLTKSHHISVSTVFGNS